MLQPGHGEDEIEVEGGAPAGGDVGVFANARGVLKVLLIFKPIAST